MKIAVFKISSLDMFNMFCELKSSLVEKFSNFFRFAMFVLAYDKFA